MAARQPYKTVGIDKKLGDVYFTNKCLLYGPFPAPQTNPFATHHAEALAKKCSGKVNKPIKIKIACLIDSLALMKKSRFGKKPPYARIKYAEVKSNNLFPSENRTVVICIQLTGKGPEYLAVVFEQPLKATQLYDRMAYAELAPKNNLKNIIPAIEQDVVIPSTPSPQPATNNQVLTPTSTRRSSSSSSSSSTTSSAVKINIENRESAHILEDLNRQIPENVSRVTSLPRQAYSSSTTPSTSSASLNPARLSTPMPKSPSIRQSPTTQGVRGAPTPVDPPLCSQCKLKNSSRISTSTSPIKGMSSKPNEGLSPGKTSRSRQTESPTSITSRHTLTTDASSRFVVEEEKLAFEDRFNSGLGVEADVRPRRSRKARSTSPSSSSSSSSTTFLSESSSSSPLRKRHSRKHKRSRPHGSSRASSVRPYGDPILMRENNYNDYVAPENRSKKSKSLFILASGQFKPFSELDHEPETDVINKGMCSICGEIKSGRPKKVEMIKTDGSRGPVLSEDGTVYMYSKTRPVNYPDIMATSPEGPRRSRRNRQPSLSRNSSTSRSRGRSTPGRNSYAVLPLKANGMPIGGVSPYIYPPSQPQRNDGTCQSKMIYRLESTDSSSSESSCSPTRTTTPRNIKITPLN